LSVPVQVIARKDSPQNDLYSVEQYVKLYSVTYSLNPVTSPGCLQIQLNKFPGDSRRDFKKNPGHVCIASACYVMWSCLPCRCSLPKYRTKTWYAFYI